MVVREAGKGLWWWDDKGTLDPVLINTGQWMNEGVNSDRQLRPSLKQPCGSSWSEDSWGFIFSTPLQPPGEADFVPGDHTCQTLPFCFLHIQPIISPLPGAILLCCISPSQNKHPLFTASGPLWCSPSTIISLSYILTFYQNLPTT